MDAVWGSDRTALQAAGRQADRPLPPHRRTDFINLAKNPDRVWLEVGNRKVKVTPTLLKGREREEALTRIAAIAPRFGEYPKKTDREIPLVRLEAA